MVVVTISTWVGQPQWANTDAQEGRSVLLAPEGRVAEERGPRSSYRGRGSEMHGQHQVFNLEIDDHDCGGTDYCEERESVDIVFCSSLSLKSLCIFNVIYTQFRTQSASNPIIGSFKILVFHLEFQVTY